MRTHFGSFRRLEARLGFGLRAWIEKARGLGLDFREHGLALFDPVTGAQCHAMEITGNGRGNYISMPDAGLAFLENGNGERPFADSCCFNFERLGRRPATIARKRARPIP